MYAITNTALFTSCGLRDDVGGAGGPGAGGRGPGGQEPTWLKPDLRWMRTRTEFQADSLN